MRLILFILIVVLIIGFFLYSKLLPHKDRLNPKYRKMFNTFHSVFNPVLNLLKGIFKPFQIGNGIAVDTAQIIFIFLLLLILKIID